MKSPLPPPCRPLVEVPTMSPKRGFLLLILTALLLSSGCAHPHHHHWHWR
ncbi:hypothetical protein FTUN_3956 [Frigoriglobus tundricola]|uniref:Uncharacterized protein n=1 Tax=Frigoriglobus tundricola TaxID=2774151 RepID=A0A6M5YQY9_9BACT|nr:hypothetical protein FTUN_3956 [Frigoriglobus tundricola]